MSKKLTKAELVAALTSSGVTISPSASLTQLRNLHDVECSGVNSLNAVADAASEITDSASQGARGENEESVLDEMIVSLEKRRKVLELQKEVQQLEQEIAGNMQSMSITDIDNIVPKFTGDNAYSIEKWIVDFENAMTICKSSAQFKYMSARRLLGGTAAIFLRTSSAQTYFELKAELLQQFQRHISANDVYKELYARRRSPKENIIAYMLSMKEIAAQADLGQEELINAIIEGLGDRSAHTSVLYTAKNLDELKHLMLIYEKRRPNTIVAERKEKPSSEPRCFNCSKSGHISTQCLQPKRMNGSCFRCGGSDHQIKNCPKKTSTIAVHTVEADDEVYPVEPNQKVSVAFCYRNMNNIEYTEHFSLIDSGSPVSLVCQRLLPFEMSDDIQVTSPFCGMGGTEIKTYGQIEGEILLNNKIKKLNFYIVSDNMLKKPLLLGRDFLFLFDIQLCMFKTSQKKENLKKIKLDSISYNCSNIVHVPKIVFKNFNCKNYSGDLGGGLLRPWNDVADLAIGKDNDDCLSILSKTKSVISVSDHIANETSDHIDSDTMSCHIVNNVSIGSVENLDFDDMHKCESKSGAGIDFVGEDQYSTDIDVKDCFYFIGNTIVSSIEIDELSSTEADELDIGNNLSISEKLKIRNIIDQCFISCPKSHVEKPLEMSIKLTSNQPVYSPPRRLSILDKEQCQKITDDLLNKGIIKHSYSPYASPIVLVKKKNGETRMCVDYRELNKITVRDHYPLPLIEDCLDYLGGKKLFTLLDLKSGFHQVKMAADSTKYTSFVTPVGQFEYLMMPFGLTNAPSVFQRFINFILKEFIVKSKIIVYMDDILIATKNFVEHEELLGSVLTKLAEYGLELKASKCKFGYANIEYLGHSVDSKGIKPIEQHKKNIANYPLPKNLKQLHTFIGLCAYFRKFIPQFSRIAKPLYDLLKKDAKFQIDEECLKAISLLKQKLVDSPVLSIYDPTKETELHCDASAIGFGAVLMQRQEDGKFHPVFYFSQRTTPAEAKYHSFELETLAIIYALRRLRVYLEGIAFKIITDCNSLTLTLNKKVLNPRIARWALELQNYNYTIQHRTGVNMGHVDALSRCEVIFTINESEIEVQLYANQNRDVEIVKLRDVLEKKTLEKFDLQDGLVYRKTSKGELLFYVPYEMESNVIRVIHEKIGHLGVTKTYETLKANYWFPNMKTKIEQFIRNCLKCIMYSAPARVDEKNLYSIPKKPVPFDTVHIDHLGPLPCIKSKRKHLLVVVDAFTKFTKLYPVNSTSTKEVIESLKKYFVNYSRPSRIISDRGSCFTSLEFSEFLLKNNIDHVKVAVGSPQANGQVERVNRVITPMLSKLSEPIQHSDWASKLSCIEFALNNTIHCSTAKTPSQLLFGISQRGPEIDKFTEYFEEQRLGTVRDLENIRDEANTAIIRSQQRNEVIFKRSHRPAREYKVGDYVVIKNVDTRPGVNKKLIPKFKGPYVIHKKLSNDRYLVKDLENCQITQIPYNGIIESCFLRLWCEPPREPSPSKKAALI